MLDLNIIYEKQFKRHKKDSSWGSLRPASVSCDDTSSDNNWKGSGDENTLNPHSRSAASGSPLTDARTRSAKSFRCWSTAASCTLTANRRKAWRGHSFRPRQEAFGESGTPGGQAQELPERRGFISHGCWLPIELRKNPLRRRWKTISWTISKNFCLPLHFTRLIAPTREFLLHPQTLGLFRYLINFCATTPTTTTNITTTNN